MSAAEDPSTLETSFERYWEERARDFADVDQGLPAICAYGMPSYYNRAIAICQSRALSRWLPLAAGRRALDVGSGVGRWSLRMAAAGAEVTGIDLSPTMAERARARARTAGLEERCRFLALDVATLALDAEFDFVLSVTVLQHILDPERFDAALARLAAHLAPGGHLVLLEVAPHRSFTRCDSAVFQARTLHRYTEPLRAAGLEIVAVEGVDPAPLRRWLLPFHARLPRPLGHLLLAAVTALSLPIDWLAGRRAARRSWHQVIVARRPGVGP